MTQEIVTGTSSLLVAIIYCMVAFKMYDLMHYYLKKRQIEAILRFGNHFYHKCFLQYLEGCPRVSFFHLNNLYSKVGN